MFHGVSKTEQNVFLHCDTCIKILSAGVHIQTTLLPYVCVGTQTYVCVTERALVCAYTCISYTRKDVHSISHTQMPGVSLCNVCVCVCLYSFFYYFCCICTIILTHAHTSAMLISLCVFCLCMLCVCTVYVCVMIILPVY